MYEKLKEIQKLLWLNDDRMDQEILFELQDKFTSLILDVAHNENKLDDLVVAFPWLYEEV